VDKVVSTATADTSITITNAGTAGEAGSTVTLGDAALGKSNTLNITAGTDTNNTVTGGTGVDNITIASAGADTINAGAGNDTISVAGGANNLTGGAGKDTFTFTGGVGAADAAALAAKHTVITDFKGTAADKDVLDFGATAVTIADTVGGVTISAGGLITDFGANASTTLAEKITVAALVTNAATANDAVAFVHEGLSYLFVEGTGDNTAVDATDTLIELTGVSLSAGFEVSGGGDIINFA
jgi:Ca2+-binding RTX toxin-like protein